MSKRFIIECDLCHNETDEEELCQITIKAPKAKKGRSYDICASCTSKTETQLVSKNKLPVEWRFANTKITKEPTKTTIADISDDDLFVKEKRQEVLQNIENAPEIVTTNNNACLHYNRTPPMLGNVGGSKGFVQRCRGCNELIPVRSAEERHSISKGDSLNETDRS